jgi:uncharacterized protein (DUF2132 family)
LTIKNYGSIKKSIKQLKKLIWAQEQTSTSQ